jgi:hypothetical protein
MTVEEVRHVLNQCDIPHHPNGHPQPRDAGDLLHGIRRIEVMALTLYDLGTNRAAAVVRRGTRAKDRFDSDW